MLLQQDKKQEFVMTMGEQDVTSLALTIKSIKDEFHKIETHLFHKGGKLNGKISV